MHSQGFVLLAAVLLVALPARAGEDEEQLAKDQGNYIKVEIKGRMEHTGRGWEELCVEVGRLSTKPYGGINENLCRLRFGDDKQLRVRAGKLIGKTVVVKGAVLGIDYSVRGFTGSSLFPIMVVRVTSVEAAYAKK
jgi:hypothetical protein